ncbi:MAG: UDP-N-acetylmuramate--L-alanine ligase [Betaproteobacteria bacterium TMED156]|nr:MAG: UDP-N-acetylmuramate--L-alanine ligase [Betaproteobacteria bacterium TMED156]
MRNKIKKIHFVGIGGAGMSGIAEVLLTQGFEIQGSDIEKSISTNRLQSLGATIFFSHSESNVLGVDVCVVSSAIEENNPELIASKRLKIPVVPRALMLGELMRFKKGIAIAGSHGKTTTTSLVSSILASSDLDPTYVIGGKLNSDGIGARLGQGEILVAEADESDGSFLNLSPIIAAVTNIDYDHLDYYNQDFNLLKKAFISFIHRLPFYSSAVLCIEDPNIREIIPLLSRPIITVGFSNDSDIQAKNVVHKGTSVSFLVEQKGFNSFDVHLPLPGLHNVLNTLIAIGIARELEIDTAILKDSIENFSGVERRFEFFDNLKSPCGVKFSLVDDYGHHPTEIFATIEACRKAFHERKITLIFQPHRFSRTRDLFNDFVDVLSKVERLILLNVYSAGEEINQKVKSNELLKEIRKKANYENHLAQNLDEAISLLFSSIKDNEVVLVMGAGSIANFSKKIILLCNKLNQEAANG